MKMSGYEFEIRQPPPLLGEHSQEVFEEWLADTERAAVAPPAIQDNS